MRESTIERAFVRAVKRAGGEALKFYTPGRRNAPDRIVLWPHGITCFVEIKAPGQKPRPGQHREILRLGKLGFCVTVIDSSEAIDDFLREHSCL